MTRGTAYALAAVCLVLSIASTWITTAWGWPAPTRGLVTGLLVGLAVAAFGVARKQGATDPPRTASPRG